MGNVAIFGWLYGYRLMRRPNAPIFITCGGRTDGAGAQAQAVISTQAASRALGICYAHTPFECMEHAPDNSRDWARRWEELLNLGDHEVAADDLGLEPVPLDELIWKPERWNDQPLLVHVHHAHDFTDQWIDAYRLVIPLLRKRYRGFRRNQSAKASDPNQVDVAVHVRRGDVNPDSNCDRYTPNEHVLRLVQTIARLLADYGLRPRLALYSEGQPDSFRDFADFGCTLLLNEDARKTFQSLVSADVLVMAKSSFSYTAALLSEGVKIYEPFWHPPMAEWVSVEQGGQLDDVAFLSQLLGYLQRRGAGERSEASPAGARARPSPPPASAALADEVRLWATDAEAVQNVEMSVYGDRMANSVPGIGRWCSLSWEVGLAPGLYEVSAEYASGERRPTHLLIDGFTVVTQAMSDPTGGWFDANLQWATLARIRTLGDTRVISIRRDGALPHIRQLKVLSPRSTSRPAQTYVMTEKFLLEFGSSRCATCRIWKNSRTWGYRCGEQGPARTSGTCPGSLIPKLSKRDSEGGLNEAAIAAGS